MKLKVGEESWEFDPGDWSNREVMSIERALGCAFGQFMERLKGQDMGAITAAVWIMRKRTDPALRYDNVTFKLSDLDFELTPEEQKAAYDDLKTDAERETFLAGLTEDERAFVTAETPAPVPTVDPTEAAGTAP